MSSSCLNFKILTQQVPSSTLDHNTKAKRLKMEIQLLSIRSDEEPIFAFYRYSPSMGGALLFALLFMGTTFYHIFQLFKTRTWFFIPFVIGGLCMFSLKPLTVVPELK
jgi:hypothetical protein